MILHRERIGIIAQTKLLDDVVGRAPRFHLATLRETIDCLMMRAVYFFKTVGCVPIDPQRLDVVILLFGQIVAANIELERAAERDVENLQSFANRKDRQTEIKRFTDGGEFPLVAKRICIFFEHRRIRHRLTKKFLRNIGTTSEEQTICIVERDRTRARIRDFYFRMRSKKMDETIFRLLVGSRSPVSASRKVRVVRRDVKLEDRLPACSCDRLLARPFGSTG